MVRRDAGPVEVDDENFGALLVEGLEEALAVARGESVPARRVRRLTARGASVRPPARYAAPAIRRIREQLGLSQSIFAEVLNASAETVKAWEQGKRAPDGMALALLEVAERHPEALLDRLDHIPPGRSADEPGRG